MIPENYLKYEPFPINVLDRPIDGKIERWNGGRLKL